MINKNSNDKIWNKVWASQDTTNPNEIFNNRLFIEGYPVFKKYINSNVRNILDVGSGTGRYGIKFAKDMPNAQVMITDILDDSISIINQLIDYFKINNALSTKEDVLNISLSDNIFDLVFCDVVIQHIPNDKKAVSEMERVLKPGGIMIVSVNNFWNLPHTVYKFILGKKYIYGYEKSYTKKELRDLILSNDMDIIAEDGFYPAYGIYRLKYINNVFGIIGKIINRITKILDKMSNRLISKYFGFEIFVVARKK